MCVQLENDSALQASMIYIHVYPKNINKKSTKYGHNWWGTSERLEMTQAGTFATSDFFLTIPLNLFQISLQMPQQ